MTVSSFDRARRQVDFYGQEVRGWQADHISAMRCLNVEGLVRVGLSAFEFINWLDEELSLVLLRERADAATLGEMRDGINGLYQSWLVPCDRVEDAVRRCETDGYEVDGAEEFRAACREARGVLVPDAEFFSGGDLVSLRDEAVVAHRDGRTQAFGEKRAA